MASDARTSTVTKANEDDAKFYWLDEGRKAGGFMTAEVDPIVNAHWERGTFPFEIVPGFRGLGIAVKAAGVLTTRLPGGRLGYSLLIVISSEFTPVQLGLGFSLGPVFQRAGMGSYLQFMAPGVISMTVLFTSMFSGIPRITATRSPRIPRK